MARAVFPLCYLTWDQSMEEVMKIMSTSFKRSHACTAALSAPNPAAGHCWPTTPSKTHGHSLANLGQSSFLLSPVNKVRFDPSKNLFPQSSVSSGSSVVWLMVTSFQKGLYHTQVCCTQSSCPCSSPLLTHTSTGDTQTQFCLSLHGISGSWCAQDFLCAFWECVSLTV